MDVAPLSVGWVWLSWLGWVDWDGNTKCDGYGQGDGEGDGNGDGDDDGNTKCDDEVGARVAETGHKAAVVVRRPAEFA